MESRKGKNGTIPMQMGSFPRDLLRKFTPRNNFVQKMEKSSSSDEEEIELSLGLSLNGRFGVDPRAKRLMRTSSIPDFINPVREEETKNVVQMGFAPLIRTCSLPAETKEEWKKRKELQTLRRMEAKRKRNEKQRNLKMARERSRACLEENFEEDKRLEVINGNNNSNSNNTNNITKIKQEQCSKKSVFRLPSWGFSAKGVEFKAEKGNGSEQGSIGSQGSGSSGISESESRPGQGISKRAEARSPASIHSQPEGEQKLHVPPGAIAKASQDFAAVAMENPFARSSDNKGDKESISNVLESMPFVSTKGDGPSGKRVEGFLYRYKKGEEVRILCVCHGNFLSPAEFVKHGGGGDVTHPLKHIVVNPSPLL